MKNLEPFDINSLHQEALDAEKKAKVMISENKAGTPQEAIDILQQETNREPKTELTRLLLDSFGSFYGDLRGDRDNPFGNSTYAEAKEIGSTFEKDFERNQKILLKIGEFIRKNLAPNISAFYDECHEYRFQKPKGKLPYSQSIYESLSRLTSYQKQVIKKKIMDDLKKFDKDFVGSDITDDRLVVEMTRFVRKNPEVRADEIFILASLLQGHRLMDENLEQSLKNAFHGKKILVLGDDIGGLSELLNKLGGQAYGIEHDENSVALAHSGMFSEDGKLQDQVIKGSIGQLVDTKSELYRRVQLLGPFDVIFSCGVFNGGSGIERDYQSVGGQNAFYKKFFSSSEDLLNENGINLHLHVDEHTGKCMVALPVGRFVGHYEQDTVVMNKGLVE